MAVILNFKHRAFLEDTVIKIKDEISYANLKHLLCPVIKYVLSGFYGKQIVSKMS